MAVRAASRWVSFHPSKPQLLASKAIQKRPLSVNAFSMRSTDERERFTTLSRRRCRRRSGRPFGQLLAEARGARSHRVREENRHAQVARREMGRLLSGHAQLAMPAAG